MTDRPEGPDVDRFEKASRGRERNYRAPAVFVRAARWLEHRGFYDASEALASAAKGNLQFFWSETRLRALARALRSDIAPDWSSKEPFGSGAVLMNTATFLRQAALLLMLSRDKQISPVNAVRIRKCVALLAVAVLDVIDPEWRSRDWER